MNKFAKVFVILFVFNGIFIFSDNLGISDKSLEEYIADIKNNKRDASDARYLWSGLIIDIKKSNDGIEAVVLKSRWTGNEAVESFRFIIKTDKAKFIDQIDKTGLYKKIILILKVIEVRDGMPVCEPLLIKDV